MFLYNDCSERFVISCQSIMTDQLSVSSNHAIIFTSVDFPDHELPTKAIFFHHSIMRENFSNTLDNSVYPNVISFNVIVHCLYKNCPPLS